MSDDSRPGFQKSTERPRFTEPLLLRGTPCLASFPNVWSMPRKKLKPGVCTFMSQPKPQPNVTADTLADAENTLHGAIFADRRKSVQVYLPASRVVFKRPKLSGL